MDESNRKSPCKECNSAGEAQLHAEVANLRQHVADKDAHIVGIEAEFVKCTARADDLEEQVDTWREKYERLYDSHKRVQKLNQVLEDKLLQMVDKMKSEKSQLTKDIATLSVRLAESKHNYSMLQKENERYKNDMNLAIQLLQCKPDNFVSQKLDNLPVDTQARVSQYVMSKTSKPPSSSQSKTGYDLDTFDASEYEFNISASLMSKILEDSIQDTLTKHCDTCTCTKSQSKPFCYNESYYSVSTQTSLTGEMKNSLCLNCNSEIKSLKSNLSMRSVSPHGIKLLNEKTNLALGNMYILPQSTNVVTENNKDLIDKTVTNNLVQTTQPPIETNSIVCTIEKEAIKKIEEELKQLKKNNMNMEPSVHHKLCDRTKTSISSKKSSVHSIGHEDLLKDKAIDKDAKLNSQVQAAETSSLRKNSQSSMGGVSRTSSVAKSVSTHKSNTQVGPGPRFCHLRMQAGSKNILLDNAEPDVPPVLYRRQSKCTENSIFKDLNDGMENFIDLVKTEDDYKTSVNNDSVVVETTLIDVHVDNNNKDSETSIKTNSINPILLNVSSSPLQPLKTHNFSNSSEHNNNINTQSISSQQNQTDIDNLLNDFNVDNAMQNNNTETATDKKFDIVNTNDNEDIKIFNFDHYEQTKAGQFSKPLKKIDMSQLHSIENTKISKDYPPIGNLTSLDKKDQPNVKQQKSSLPAIVNVYPNLTQTHLKVNENTKVFTNEQSTSSLSSDDSAAILQKQQLLRVAEWVEKNLEQQNSFNDPLEDECNFVNRNIRRDSKLSRLTETLNELALNMPHPVSKFSKTYSRDAHNSWIHNSTHQNTNQEKETKVTKVTGNVVKETIFPVESGDVTVTEINVGNPERNMANYNMGNDLAGALKSKDKEISPEDLARMEYNVKKFLLSGPQWANPASVGRSRCTSSKTETDV
ncbi:Tight junction-associated protein 1 [Papilio machaon]|uniref:Tight junction-associated protein 1 n=1 Tax=Papilio machaon TaxID=76193 RepID=A0A194RQ79_PAPMA|nr:Tight junction-associated protein 1 [Papilio machaon]